MALASTLIGGIGLFLLGMILLTEGLKTAAGGALRSVLERLTGGPLKAFFSGAVMTAIVQSSSATMLSTIGFVSAGLLTFPQAVGVVFGASVGTTSTGWIVSLLGLKMNIGAVALPLVGAGALLRLLSSGRRAAMGLALAGFGLIFVGVDTLQDGMAVLSTRVDPAQFQAHGVGGRLLLVGVGIVMTVVMQSSSAAVAATLTALHAGAIRMEDAAVLVIGQNFGTTATAALAAIGASLAARRTALAQILFNGLTGLVAFALLPVFLMLARTVAAAVPGDADATGIAAFHTAFNLIGVAMLLPFTAPFARFVMRLLPEREDVLTRHLDPTVASVPSVAVEAVRLTAINVMALLGAAAVRLLASRPSSPPTAGHAAVALDALAQARAFLGRVRTGDEGELDRARHLAVLHVVDHLESLADALRDDEPRFGPLVEEGLGSVHSNLVEELRAVQGWCTGGSGNPPVERVALLSTRVAELRRELRPLIMERTAAGELSPDAALMQLDAMRRVDRITYHVWRATHHLSPVAAETHPPVVPEPAVESWSDEAAGAPRA